MSYRLISADSHFIEPPNLWEDWLPRKFQEIAPKLVKDRDGGDAWDYGAGEPSPLGIYAAAGKDEHSLSWTGVTYETMAQGFFRGELLYRRFGGGGVPELRTKLVKRNELAANLPADIAKVTPEQRSEQMLERFHGIIRRYGV